ncbi:DUF4267 domain-containing protein [Nocardia sp. NPDC059240]|uniref:DUF4267 domain-containing protein n=1 Tax=Nocardia sp. NPDC059240 TaxID=3346786 RepID=UPI00368FBD5C
MLSSIGYAITGLTGALLLLIGARALLAPKAAATSYGIPEVAGLEPYMTIKGGRDLGLGAITVALMITASTHALGWFMLAGTVIPLIDGINVLRSGGPKAIAFGVHHATAVVMLIGAGVLLAA